MVKTVYQDYKNILDDIWYDDISIFPISSVRDEDKTFYYKLIFRFVKITNIII
jgi:hypothetical protein